MLKIYTEIEKLPYKLITDNSAMFDAHFINYVTEDLMELIAKLEESNYLGNGVFKGKFGIYRLEDMSSGCKTILNIILAERLNEKLSFSLLSCGKNYITYIFNEINSNIPLYWQTSTLPYKIYNDIDIIVNDEHEVKTLFDLMKIWDIISE